MKTLAIATTTTVLVLTLTIPIWKGAAKTRSRWFVVGTNVYQNLLRRLGIQPTQIGKPYTLKRNEAEVPAALAGIDSTFDNYRRHLTRAEALEGKSVLEIGPGNHLGVALRFAASGAGPIVVIDKFVPRQASPFHRRLYQALRAKLSKSERDRFDTALDLSRELAPNPHVLRYIHRGIEDTGPELAPSSVDLVVSDAVLEEVHDIDRAFAVMDRALRPGGVQIHKIDLSDYGMFSKHGFHPLEFLTIPDRIYRSMAEAVGSPNRRLVDYYRRKMQELGYRATIYATWVLGGERELVPAREHIAKGRDYPVETIDRIRAIRSRLLQRYRNLPDEDLAIQGILLVARKP